MEQRLGSDGNALVIAGRTFGSRLITGTGKYASFEQMAEAIEAAGSEMVTVAVRRVFTPPDGFTYPTGFR